LDLRRSDESRQYKCPLTGELGPIDRDHAEDRAELDVVHDVPQPGCDYEDLSE
jgi:hypothetical protein